VQNGRRQSAFLANYIAIAGCIPQFFLNFWTIFVGRFLLGISSGFFIVVCSLYLKETVPSSKLSIYGTSVNFGIVLGIYLVMFL
jgi:MFS family permease